MSSIFFDHNAMKLKINHKKNTEKYTKTWKLNNMLLNNEWVNNQIKEKIKTVLETNENVWGSFARRVPRPPQMKINLPRHDLLVEERLPISQRRRTRSLFLSRAPQELLLGSVCTEIQVKLINHCQAVRIKQYITYKEL